jgi:hypothetical protein
MKRDYYVSCPWATGMVSVNGLGVITDTPPIWRKFIGQRLTNLMAWLKAENVRIEPLGGKDE